MKKALILVDIQNDFLPGGSLAVAGGDEILRPVIDLMQSDKFDLIIATQDWHPIDHISFASMHEGKKPFEKITVNGQEQTLWPTHCVQDTYGARLNVALPESKIHAIIRKGYKKDVDSYSAFRDNWGGSSTRRHTGLCGYLQDNMARDLYICGLARDVCVDWTARDANKAPDFANSYGMFKVNVIWDCTRSVNPRNDEELRRLWSRRGIWTINSTDLLDK